MAVNGIGVCSWSLQPDSPADLVQRLASTGLSKVQLALSPAVSDRDHWGDVIEVLEAAGVSIASGMLAPVGEDYSTLETIARTGGIRPNTTWPANEAMARAMAVVGNGAGIELVTLHAGFLPHDREDPERGRMVKRLQTLASIFSDQGIHLAFETGQETAETLLEVLGDIDRESVGVNFDPANMVLYGMGDPVEALQTLSQYVFQVHIKDALPTQAPGTWGREVPAGTGSVDWDGFFKVVDSNDLEVEAIIEREAGGSRVEDILAAADLVRRHAGSGVA